jgi:hypothetical protein
VIFLVITNTRVPVSQLLLVMGLKINLPIALDETLDWQHTERCTSRHSRLEISASRHY